MPAAIWPPTPTPSPTPSLNLGGTGGGLNLGGQMPAVPWGQNPLITTAALGMLGGRTLNQGLQNVAQLAPAGLAAKTNLQTNMYKVQEDKAAQARQMAAWNAGMKWKSGATLTAADEAALAGSPEVAIRFMPEPVETYRPLTDPAERAQYGINPEDTSPYQVGPGNKISAVGGASTNISLNEGKLTEGQSKDVNFYARGRAADKELTPQLEKALTDLPATMWSNTPLLGNYGQTPEFQSAKRAAAEFLAVVLRKDTGAAVTPQEFAAYGPMYLPVPGDTEEVLTAKRTARKRVMDSIKRGLGTARELADEIDTEMAAEPTSTSENPDDPLGIGGM